MSSHSWNYIRSLWKVYKKKKHSICWSFTRHVGQGSHREESSICAETWVVAAVEFGPFARETIGWINSSMVWRYCIHRCASKLRCDVRCWCESREISCDQNWKRRGRTRNDRQQNAFAYDVQLHALRLLRSRSSTVDLPLAIQDSSRNKFLS